MSERITSPKPSFLKYWGKAKPIEAAEATWHPLAYHALDVAAVGVSLISADERLRVRVGALSGLGEHAALRWAFLALALHDLGKFAPSFQAKSPELFDRQFGEDGWRGPHTGHDVDGLVLWHQRLAGREDVLAAFCTASGARPHIRRSAATAWVASAMCHHGKPRDTSGALLPDRFKTDHLDAVDAFVTNILALAARIGRPFERPPPTQAVMTWPVSGFSVLADWIGSSQQWFPYREPDLSLAEYWERHALPRAGAAAREAGVIPARASVSVPLADLLPTGAQPSPLQRAVDMLEIGTQPQLFVIEDQTGSGKTEAALALAARLIAAGRADGLFVALPTMATANAMYDRCAKLYRRLFAAGEEPSIVLAHSRRDLVLKGVPLRGRAEEGDYDATTETASAACARWLGDDRRKATLADCGVGTIDQAVMAVMPSRFQSLRLLGLGRKVVIVDEVHAYDPYLRELVCGLLRFHGALGGSAILLSATLPARLRQAFVNAFAEGRGAPAQPIAQENDPYPLLTHFDGKAPVLHPVAPRAGLDRDLAISFVRDSAEAAHLVMRAARDGKAVCWIRNTVADAMEAFGQVRWQVPSLHFHARFAMGDRLAREQDVLRHFGRDAKPHDREGRVLIATQVVEQSLDLDFDVMVTDLAPIDLLIQRAGRLWRHARAGRNGQPTLAVLSPDPRGKIDSGWYKRMFPRAAMVYRDHAALWLTARELQRRGVLHLPRDARPTIEAVYGAEAGDDLPEALSSIRFDAEGRTLAATATGATAILPVAKGYPDAVGHWEDDVRVPTRLGEPQTLLRLAQWSRGQLQPWCNGDDWRAWRLSEVTVLRRYVASTPPSADAGLEAAIAATRAGWPERHDESVLVPLVPAADESGTWIGQALDIDQRAITLNYDSQMGLALQRGG